MSSDSRFVIDRPEQRSRWRRSLDVLARFTQRPETVERSARLQIVSGNVEDLDPPEDIDELHNLYQEIGVIRANLNQFVSDVVKPGVRVEADTEATADWFNGADDLPDDAPDGGFLSQAFVFAGEKRQPFIPGLKATVLNRWTRGTILHEFVRAEGEETEPDGRITAFKHVRPETVSARVYNNTNILLDPDDTDAVDATEITKRGEAAAYVQFDEESVLGRRFTRTNGSRGIDFSKRSSILLSQRDVMKQVLDPDIGGDATNEHGIFGTSILRAVKDDATEYRTIKRDRHTAIQTKAYGIWFVNFQEEVLDTGNEKIRLKWDDADQDDLLDQMGSLDPGDIISGDGPAELMKFDSDVPDLDATLKHYVDDITAPLPAPKYSVGFEKDINQFVTERQETRYQQVIEEERHYQEHKWTEAFRRVAETHGLDTAGLRVVIEPQQEESPVMSLTEDDIERLERYAGALADIYGPGGTSAFIDNEILTELILQLPEDAEADVEELGIEDITPEAD